MTITNRHRIGIIGTLIFHLVLLTIAYLSEINQHIPETFLVLIDPDTLDETPEEEVERLKEELSKEVDKLYEQLDRNDPIKNVAVNKDYEEQKPTEFKPDMTDEEYERELVRNSLDQKEFEKYIENKPTLEEEEIAIPVKKKEKKEKSQKSAYKGPGTVVYFLKGRTSIYLDIPAYTCEGSAQVTIDIEVDPSGRVFKASLNSEKSNYASDCYKNAAIESAKSAIFSSVETSGRQKGTIEFQFIAQ
ncbi:MAG: hypothetical protein PHU27_01665 [Salinivirgaceae bacterium]|nr:hypothetical protein [Salinivirgaceae bacterium]MDD4746975.1 hypothetical protein [Salinivirgaceae bacterium]MDY0280529.1 hypothetical protein [Salinivirgaceae bacterium]